MYVERCKDCRHYSVLVIGGKTYDNGMCKRHAPVLYMAPHNSPKTVWPGVKEDDVCGDFDARHPLDGPKFHNG